MALISIKTELKKTLDQLKVGDESYGSCIQRMVDKLKKVGKL